MSGRRVELGVPRSGDDLLAFGAIVSHAFAMGDSVPDSWFELAGHDNIRLLRRDDEIVAGLVLIPMGQWFGRRAVSMTGIAGVAVRSDVRRLGLASTMMREMLREQHAAGIALSTLYGSNHSLYRGCGYEHAGSRFIARVAPSTLRFAERGAVVRRATDDDDELVARMYAQSARAQPGALERGSYIWPRLTRERFGAAAYGMIVEEEGESTGYVYYRKVDAKPAERHEVHVTDAVALTPVAGRRIWTFLGDLGAMVTAIEMPSAPTDTLYALHPHPFASLTLYENWMLRVVRVDEALRARGYAPGVSARVELAVDDEVFEENRGPWVVRVADGRATVTRGGGGSVRAHIRGLAAVYGGFASPEQMQLVGLMDGPAPALEALGAIFAGPAPWMREGF